LPGRNGAKTMHIVRLVRTQYLNGLPLDFLVAGHRVREFGIIEFGISFAKTEPLADVYPLPVLWMQEGGDWKGIWIRGTRFLS